jgi:hypothetical protein
MTDPDNPDIPHPVPDFPDPNDPNLPQPVPWPDPDPNQPIDQT